MTDGLTNRRAITHRPSGYSALCIARKKLEMLRTKPFNKPAAVSDVMAYVESIQIQYRLFRQRISTEETMYCDSGLYVAV